MKKKRQSRLPRIDKISDINETYINSLRKEVNENGCWIWQGSMSRNNRGMLYPSIRILNKTMRLTRLVAHVYHGLDLSDDKTYAMHKCDETKCFNPEHITVGTPRDNAMDAIKKNKHFQLSKTHCAHGHPFDGIKKNNERTCSICIEMHVRRSQEKKELLSKDYIKNFMGENG